jgi:hypothetical protein
MSNRGLTATAFKLLFTNCDDFFVRRKPTRHYLPSPISLGGDFQFSFTICGDFSHALNRLNKACHPRFHSVAIFVFGSQFAAIFRTPQTDQTLLAIPSFTRWRFSIFVHNLRRIFARSQPTEQGLPSPTFIGCNFCFRFINRGDFSLTAIQLGAPLHPRSYAPDALHYHTLYLCVCMCVRVCLSLPTALPM